MDGRRRPPHLAARGARENLVTETDAEKRTAPPRLPSERSLDDRVADAGGGGAPGAGREENAIEVELFQLLYRQRVVADDGDADGSSLMSPAEPQYLLIEVEGVGVVVVDEENLHRLPE
jgi:hypothetical protein